jgi:hypothetical protein
MQLWEPNTWGVTYGTLKETIQQGTIESSLIGMQEKEKNNDNQEDNGKKDEDNTEDKGFQQPKGMVTIIFSRIPGSRSKHQDK